jgi:hypothetical protein
MELRARMLAFAALFGMAFAIIGFKIYSGGGARGLPETPEALAETLCLLKAEGQEDAARDLAFGQRVWPQWCPYGGSAFNFQDYSSLAVSGLRACTVAIADGDCAVTGVETLSTKRFSKDCLENVHLEQLRVSFAGIDARMTLRVVGGPTAGGGDGWLIAGDIGCE